MRWKDGVKRDLEREGGEWRTTANDRRNWKLLIDNLVRKSDERKFQEKDDDNHGQSRP